MLEALGPLLYTREGGVVPRRRKRAHGDLGKAVSARSAHDLGAGFAIRAPALI
jgi:hypothetical protein